MKKTGDGIRRICARCGEEWATTPGYGKVRKYICPKCAQKENRKAGVDK